MWSTDLCVCVLLMLVITLLSVAYLGVVVNATDEMTKRADEQKALILLSDEVLNNASAAYDAGGKRTLPQTVVEDENVLSLEEAKNASGFKRLVFVGGYSYENVRVLVVE